MQANASGSKTTCAKDCRLDMKQCAFKEMTKKMRFHKRSFSLVYSNGLRKNEEDNANV